MILPPLLTSMSDPRKHTCRSSAAAPTVAISSRSTPAARSAPFAAISASAPSKRRNATVAVRCSDGCAPASTCLRSAGESEPATSASSGAHRGSSSVSWRTSGAERSRCPPALAGPRQPGGNAAAAALLRRMSPAAAAFSIRVTSVVAAPVTSSWRWEPPTTKRWNSPLCTPTDIRSPRTGPPLADRAATRSSWRIVIALLQARTACASPSNSSSSASPPNLSSEPPFVYATRSSRSKQLPMASASCSAPSRPPRRARHSEQLREARDVHEHDGRVKRVDRRFGRLGQVPQQHTGDVRVEAAGAVRAAGGHVRKLGGLERQIRRSGRFRALEVAHEPPYSTAGAAIPAGLRVSPRARRLSRNVNDVPLGGMTSTTLPRKRPSGQLAA